MSESRVKVSTVMCDGPDRDIPCPDAAAAAVQGRLGDNANAARELVALAGWASNAASGGDWCPACRPDREEDR